MYLQVSVEQQVSEHERRMAEKISQLETVAHEHKPKK